MQKNLDVARKRLRIARAAEKEATQVRDFAMKTYHHAVAGFDATYFERLEAEREYFALIKGAMDKLFP